MQRKEINCCMIVEDAISACRGSIIFDTIAILGTSIAEEVIPYILPYTRVLIALDPDATSKSLRIQKQLSPYIETLVVPIKKDIKYFNLDEIKELENEYR